MALLFGPPVMLPIIPSSKRMLMLLTCRAACVEGSLTPTSLCCWTSVFLVPVSTGSPVTGGFTIRIFAASATEKNTADGENIFSQSCLQG